MNVYVFFGDGATFPGGVFSSKEEAIRWINFRLLSGTLTAYPIDMGVYDWAISNDYFRPTESYQFEAKFIQRFSSASAEHFHFENGIQVTF